jgi:hypothetical protein
MIVRKTVLVFLAVLIMMIFSACERAPVTTPTPIPTAPLPTRDAATLAPSIKTSDCIDSFYFTEWEDFEDGSLLKPGETFVKEWEIVNNGSCNWNANYKLRFISGDQMSAPDVVALPQTAVGKRGIISVTFIAPDVPGSYRSSWKAFNGYNQSFGNTLFAEIVVEGEVPTVESGDAGYVIP